MAAGDVVVKGANEFTAQPLKRHYVRGEGWTDTQDYYGPYDKCADKEAELLVSDPDEINSVYGTPKATITVITKTEPDDYEENTVWELLPSHIDKPLATHPAFASTDENYAITIEKIEHALSRHQATATDWSVGTGMANANDYRNLRLMGVDSYRMWTYTIRRTITVPQNSEYKITFTDVGRVVPYNEIPLPDDIKWEQPTILKWAGPPIADQNPAVVPIDEWLHSAPTVRFEKRKYSVMEDWIGAEKWYEILYPGGTAKANEHGFSQA